MKIFIARQAIYNRNCRVVGYELLFRNSEVNMFDSSVDADEATVKLISNFSTIGLNELTNNKRAYINFTKRLLLNEVPSLLPKEKIVIEVLEDIEPSKKILAILRELKGKGYLIALDDVCSASNYKEFKDYIDIYKIDFMKSSKEERPNLIDEILKINPMAKFLAEKVENDDDYDEVCYDDRYFYYQGYYFSKPIMVSAKDIPIRNTTCFQIMTELLNENFNVSKIENIMKRDVAISYKLIKLLNSAAFSFVQEITSIRQGIMILGRDELNKWITLVSISEMKSDNGEEMMVANIIRARFCELLSLKILPEKSNTCFMAGLFSNLDIYMQRDMKSITNEMPINNDLREALLSGNNNIGYILRLVKAYEEMYIEDIEVYTKILGVDKELLLDIYFISIEWANNIINKNLKYN